MELVKPLLVEKFLFLSQKEKMGTSIMVQLGKDLVTVHKKGFWLHKGMPMPEQEFAFLERI